MSSGDTRLVFLLAASCWSSQRLPFGCGDVAPNPHPHNPPAARPLPTGAWGGLRSSQLHLGSSSSRGKRKGKWFPYLAPSKGKEIKAKPRGLRGPAKPSFLPGSAPAYLPLHHGHLSLPPELISFGCSPGRKGRWPF